MAGLRPRAEKASPTSDGGLSARVNLLLTDLPPATERRFVTRCEPIHLKFGEALWGQGERIRHVYFPTGGFVSLLSEFDGRTGLEVGLVGTEGAVGASLSLGIDVAPLGAVVQGGGPALRMEAALYIEELARSLPLRKAMNRYAYVLMTQLAQMAVCARFHVVEARLARWLLMTRDRAASDEFYITQDFMAYMLGVRRAGVTEAASAFQKRRLVSYSRGRMSILNVRGMQAASCACYSLATNTYTRFMGHRGTK